MRNEMQTLNSNQGYQYSYPEEGLCPYSIGNKFCSLLNIRGACNGCETYKNAGWKVF